MTEHQTPGWQLPQQLHRDEPPEEQDVIAASKEVTLQQQQLLPRERRKQPQPIRGLQQPWLTALCSPGSSLVQLSASQNHPQVPEQTTRGLAGGHRGGFGPAPQTSLRKAKPHKALCVLLIHSNMVSSPQSPVSVPQNPVSAPQSPKQSSLLCMNTHTVPLLSPTPSRGKTVQGGPKPSFSAEETPALQSAEKRGEVPSWLHSAVLTLCSDLRQSKPLPSAAESQNIPSWKGLTAL